MEFSIGESRINCTINLVNLPVSYLKTIHTTGIAAITWTGQMRSELISHERAEEEDLGLAVVCTVFVQQFSGCLFIYMVFGLTSQSSLSHVTRVQIPLHRALC
jgi:hypothetical protein